MTNEQILLTLYGIRDFLRHAHHQEACDELELNELAINGDGGA